MQQLDDAAFEMGEIFTSRSHSIGAAIALDPAFRRTLRPKSSLTYDLMSEAFSTAMSRVGLHARTGAGGALEVGEYVHGGYALIRLRRAGVRRGEYFVRANTASNFGRPDDTLVGPDLPHVFGFTIDAQEQPGFFVARVLRIIEGNPGELELGTPLSLGGTPATEPTMFLPDADDRLPGWDDDELDEGNQTAL